MPYQHQVNIFGSQDPAALCATLDHLKNIEGFDLLAINQIMMVPRIAAPGSQPVQALALILRREVTDEQFAQMQEAARAPNQQANGHAEEQDFPGRGGIELGR